MASRKSEERMTLQALLTLRKRIMRRLENAGATGMSRSDLYKSLGHPITARAMDMALNTLKQRGDAKVRRVETGMRGRPCEVWWAAKRRRDAS